MLELIFSHPAGIVLYLGMVNLTVAAATVHDKKQARTYGRHVPRKNLFALATLGGSPAMLVTMHIIRRKTQYRRFILDPPLIILAQLIIVSLVYQSTR